MTHPFDIEVTFRINGIVHVSPDELIQFVVNNINLQRKEIMEIKVRRID